MSVECKKKVVYQKNILRRLKVNATFTLNHTKLDYFSEIDLEKESDFCCNIPL